VSAAPALQAPTRRLPVVEPVWELRADIVVVGLGAAGMTAARVAAEAGRDVLVLSKAGIESSATYAAQGGLAAVVASDDDIALHAADTVAAGSGLCAPSAVGALVRQAPGEIVALRELGARFDVSVGDALDTDPAFDLGREGGHSRRRIVHARGDESGAEVASTLMGGLPRSVRIVHPVVLLDVLLDADGAAVGVLAARIGDDGLLAPGHVHARAVVLATGGFGQAWATTSSPPGITGDGLVAALRAGADVRDVEFVQFHPTVLYSPSATGQRPLATEALRGEGAVIVDHRGDRVMLGEHPMADLAPRDVVAAAMARRMRTAPVGLDTHLFLDASSLGRDVLSRFGRFVSASRAEGHNPYREPVPIAPGAHYVCGGVAADMSGRTTVRGLYAVGEVASTGAHGANRLASNSLTEALATGRRCGRLLARRLPRAGGQARNLDSDSRTDRSSGLGVDPTARRRLAATLSSDVGVVRTEDGLQRALKELDAVPAMQPSAAGSAHMSVAEVEALSLHTVSTLVAAAALVREESRGCHRRDDHPATDDRWRRRLTLRGEAEAVSVFVGPPTR
jgi:L-aspartate oxidase